MAKNEPLPSMDALKKEIEANENSVALEGMKIIKLIAPEYLSKAPTDRTVETLIALLQQYGKQVRQDQKLIDARIVVDFANEHRDLGFHSMGKLANLIAGEVMTRLVAFHWS